jgi:hypothetical protein
MTQRKGTGPWTLVGPAARSRRIGIDTGPLGAAMIAMRGCVVGVVALVTLAPILVSRIRDELAMSGP